MFLHLPKVITVATILRPAPISLGIADLVLCTDRYWEISIARLVIEDTAVGSLDDEIDNNPNNKLSAYKHVDHSFPKLLQRHWLSTHPGAHPFISRHV